VALNQKRQILEYLKARAQKDLDEAQNAALNAESFKFEDSMKQEGKYDTRSIEAGYLAGAQKKRVEELKQELTVVGTPEQILVLH